MKTLYGKILGRTTATYDDLASAVSGGYKNYANFGDIVLDFGGYKWAVTYVTQSKGGAVSATLILAENIPNEYYQWNSYTSGTVADYPSNMYSSSEIRVKTLNAGGDDGSYAYNADGDGSAKYATGINTLSTVSRNDRVNNRWSAFTLSSDLVGKKSLTDFILQPKDLDYQSDENHMNYYNSSSTTSAEGANLSANEAYGIPEPNNAIAGGSRWYVGNGENFNYGGDTSVGQATNIKAGYSDWQYDYLWLASTAEIGTPYYGVLLGKAVTGIWGIPSDRSVSSQIRTASDNYWLRNGGLSVSENAMYVQGHASLYNYSGDIYAHSVTSNCKLRPCLHLNLTAAEDASKAKAPAEDTTEFKYTGGTLTYNPVGFDSNVMSISGNTSVAVGTTTVTVTLKSGYVWSDGATEADGTTPKKYEFQFVIGKGTPTVNPKYEAVEKRYPADGLPTLTNTGTAGTFAWKEGQTPVVGTNDYAYVFTPTDTDNWNTYEGTVSITYDQPTIKSISAEIKSGDTVYDVYTADDLKSHLTVKAVYDDNSEHILLSSEYSVTIKSNNGKLVAGKKNTLFIEETGGTAFVTYDIPEVTEAKIDSFVLVLLSDTEFTYPVQESDIIDALSQVRVKWNYSPNTAVVLTDYSGLTVVGSLDAGEQSLKLKSGDAESDEFTVNIAKGIYPDADKITFEDKTVTFGGEHSLVAENLPDGVTVTYVYGGEEYTEPIVFEEVNENGYEITAKFTHANPNYEDIADVTAKLIITAKKLYGKTDLSVTGDGLTVDGNLITATYSGEALTVTPTGKVKDENGGEVTSAYTTAVAVTREGEEVLKITDAGVYTVTVTYTMPAEGAYADYEQRFEIKYTLTVNKADFDMGGISFSDKSVSFDGEAHSIEIEGTLPEWITVTYEGNGVSEAGTHTVTAKFSHENPNYNEIADMTATLIIGAGAYVPSFKFEDITVEYNGEKHTVAPDGEIPEWLTVKFYCDGEEFNGADDVGEYEITVKFTHENSAYGEIADMKVTLIITKAKVKLPEYIGSYAYTGSGITPVTTDFDGFNADIMKIEATDATKAGGHTVRFTLTDTDRYEWEDGNGEASWSIAKATVSASKTAGRLPEFSSESYKGSFDGIVSYKYYTDEACSEEVHPDDLEIGQTYFVKAELTDGDNFALDKETAEKYFNNAFSFTVKEPEAESNFLKDYWMYIAIGAGVLLLLIILIVALSRRKASADGYDDEYYGDDDDEDEDDDDDYDDDY